MNRKRQVSFILSTIIPIIAAVVSAKLGSVAGVWEVILYITLFALVSFVTFMSQFYENEISNISTNLLDKDKTITEREKELQYTKERISELLTIRNDNSPYKISYYTRDLSLKVLQINRKYKIEILVNSIAEQYRENIITIHMKNNIEISQDIINSSSYEVVSPSPIIIEEQQKYTFKIKDSEKRFSQTKCIFYVKFKSIEKTSMYVEVSYIKSHLISKCEEINLVE
ncbi:hypothetical protein [Clostridium paridis]|uniref:Uncharacterized protein n=1 Tax=Clostridium paridis TaxID=2803863 RepID=A0A937FK35_9CLOT|nr:hypothetical protein [Clostridium paridis]MBL4933933.1 hypothetical protein [Clostridium paridis]